jgi:DNA-binding NarL/FixJ family response regulator
MNTAMPLVIVLDDHPLVGRGMAQFLRSLAPTLNVVVVTRWSELAPLTVDGGDPLLLVADVWLADGPCLESLQQWCRAHPATPWLAVSGDDDPTLARRVQAAGARGFVNKAASPEQFGQAFQAVLGGGQWFKQAAESSSIQTAAGPRTWQVSAQSLGLTPRQGEILSLVLRGLPNKRIALQLGISESTVKEHVTGILERLGVRSRVEVITRMRGSRLELP